MEIRAAQFVARGIVDGEGIGAIAVGDVVAEDDEEGLDRWNGLIKDHVRGGSPCRRKCGGVAGGPALIAEVEEFQPAEVDEARGAIHPGRLAVARIRAAAHVGNGGDDTIGVCRDGIGAGGIEMERHAGDGRRGVGDAAKAHHPLSRVNADAGRGRDAGEVQRAGA